MLSVLVWIGIVLLGIAIWSILIEPHWYRFRRMKLRIPGKLKTAVTILHLSDMHFTKRVGLKKLFFQKLAMLNPDLIFITGDTIESDAGIETAVRWISGLRARYGIFLVPGNHEYYDYRLMDHIRYHMGVSKISVHRNDSKRFFEAVKRVGVKVLIDESIELSVHGNALFISWTDDPLTQKVDFKRTFKGITPERLNILLTHHLDCITQLPTKDVDLVFSGHTHGGQIRLPVIGPVFSGLKLPRCYVDGLNQYEGMTIFVSRGLGAGKYCLPRIACRPEAVLFEVEG